MRILVLGADGMLGHQLVQSWRERHEVAGTVRQPHGAYAQQAAYLPSTTYDGVDVRDFALVRRVIDTFQPQAVVNAVGIVKQRAESKQAIISLEVNSLLPHRLSLACEEAGARLVQLSTDCVFSGAKGSYEESDAPDADTLYGRSKLLGEVEGETAVTLRTSIIGLELSRRHSLVEWFLAQTGPIRGFRRAIYSGFTTLEMARIIEHVLLQHPRASGVYQVSSEPIDKYSLLVSLRDRLGKRLQIDADESFQCDRSLRSDRFRREFGYEPPSWGQMLDELAQQIRERYP